MRRTFAFIPTAVVSATVVTLLTSVSLSTAGCGGNPTPATPSLAGPLSAAAPLVNSVAGAVPGLSQAQSILGVGSLLGLAKGRMPASQFSQVSSAIPGADALIGEATKQGLPSSLGGLSDVAGFLGKSGISSSQVNQMIPALGNAVSPKMSPDLASAFLGALK